MKLIKRFALAATLSCSVGFAFPAHAQATRTWVSGVGDDVNPCSRTAPCKTFAGAISKTAPGGEISCLDPGGFGAVTIIKSMTISCPYTEGGVLAGGNGIVVNAAATDVVYLRGLDIFGVNPPTNGVRFLAGAALHIEDSVIRRFNAVNSFGVSFVPTTAAKLFIANTTIAENGEFTAGGGINIQPGVGGSAQAVLRGVKVRNNFREGIKTDSTNGQVSFVVENSEISGNRQGILAIAGVPVNRGMVTASTISHNSVVGIITSGANTTVRVDTTTITANAQGLIAGASTQLLSYGGNRLDGNPSSGAANDGAFTGVIIPHK
jgi:hypothetical protein